MITCENFIYALYPRMGIKLTKSSNLSDVLTDRNLNYLCHIGDNAPEPVYMQAWFPNEKLLSISYIRPTKDSYGRKGVWNHTIIIDIDDYLSLTQPSNFFSSYFIRDLKEPPLSLEAITL